MIIDDISRLQIRGTRNGATAARVSAVLGVMPTELGERGDARYSSRTKPFKNGRTRTTSLWVLEVAAGEESDIPFTSMSRLLDMVEAIAERLDGLRSDYDITLDWFGDSRGSQASLSIPSKLLQRMAALDLDLSLEVISSE